MTSVELNNHLSSTFYTTPKLARQMMTIKQWRETSLATNGRIFAVGETWELYAESRGGGMYEVRARLTYWKGGKHSKSPRKE